MKTLKIYFFFAQRLLELSYNKSDFKEKSLKISTLDLIDELLNFVRISDR